MLIQAWAVGSAPGNSKETPLSKLWEPRVITLLQNFLVTSACGFVPKPQFMAVVSRLCERCDSFHCSGEPELGKPTQLLVAQTFRKMLDRLGAHGNKGENSLHLVLKPTEQCQVSSP